MSRRADVHSPTNLITEDYEYAYAYDACKPTAAKDRLLDLIAAGWLFADNPSGGDCYHCGHRPLRYIAVLKHLPSFTLIKVGETCLDNRFDRASADFHALRKQAQLDREQQRIKTRREEWLAENADRRVAYDWTAERVAAGDHGWDGFYFNFQHKVNRYGDTTDKFVAAILRAKQREEEKAQARLDEEPSASPAPSGDVMICGEVLSVKWKENGYGGSLKMLVKDAHGFKVWCSVPKAIDTVNVKDSDGHHNHQGSLPRGMQISFYATLTPSDDDPTFAFGKRPRGAILISAPEGYYLDGGDFGHPTIRANAA